jgi:Ca2+-binding RTX toxin-like protein
MSRRATLAGAVVLVLALVAPAAAMPGGRNAVEPLALYGQWTAHPSFFPLKMLALDASGNVYANVGFGAANKAIVAFDGFGNPIDPWTVGAPVTYTDAWGIDVGADGTVWIADYGNDKVRSYALTGSELDNWGGTGTAAGEFRGVLGLAVTDAHVYTTEESGNRIQKFTLEGAFVASWGSGGTGDGQFDHPNGIDVASGGTVYVADTENGRIQYFTGDGTYLGQWVPHGPPRDVAAAGGVVYVSGEGFVEKYGPTGTLLGAWYPPGGITYFGVDADGAGNVYAASQVGTSISRLLDPAFASCNGTLPTVFGTGGPDVLEGTGGADLIGGGAGDDVITGFGGDDVICGGPGDDLIKGGPGHDLLLGGDGKDNLRGAAGNDTLVGGAGSDRLLPEAGEGIADGGPGSDLVDYRTMVAKPGPGSDPAGSVDIDLVAGTAALTRNGTTETVTLTAIEKAYGTFGGDDGLRGDARRNVLKGFGGSDSLDGRGGDDDVIGGTEPDELLGGPGDDLVKGQAHDDLLDGADGKDVMRGGPGTDELIGGAGDDRLYGGLKRDTAADGDVLRGQAGTDLCWWGTVFDGCEDELP